MKLLCFIFGHRYEFIKRRMYFLDGMFIPMWQGHQCSHCAKREVKPTAHEYGYKITEEGMNEIVMWINGDDSIGTFDFGEMTPANRKQFKPRVIEGGKK